MDCSPLNNDHYYVRQPCCFTEISVMKKYRFNTDYKISADAWFFRICKINNLRFRYIPLCITIFDSYSGLSSKNKAKSFIEDMRIENVNPISFIWIKGYMKSYFSFLIQRISPSLYGRIACLTKKDRISNYTIQDGEQK
jgi:hypothetical protein